MTVPVVRPDGTRCSSFDFGRYSSKNRARLSGAGLRTFLNIADLWQLTPFERRIILGWPSYSTYRRWVGKAQRNEPLTLSVDVLMRISSVLSIYAALKVLVGDDGQLDWLCTPLDEASLAGRVPLALLTDGTQDGLMAVLRALHSIA